MKTQVALSSQISSDIKGKPRPSLRDWLTLDQLKCLAAGGAAGAVSRTCVSPLERMKILYQVQTEKSIKERKFKGIIPSLAHIWREEGIIGYFKGNGTNVIRIVPYVAVQFAAYEELKKLLNISSDPRQATPFKRLVAGAMAGVTSVTVTYPLDLVRTRLSVQGEGLNRKYRNIRHAFQTILKEEGGVLSGSLYRGLLPTLAGIAPYVGLNFAIYETLKGHFMRQHVEAGDDRQQVVIDDELPMIMKLGCGATSGACAQTITYPLDVIRRRMQMKGVLGNRFPYSSTPNAIATIFRREGVAGFYKGVFPNLLKVAPSMGITFVTYEFVKARLFGVPIKWS